MFFLDLLAPLPPLLFAVGAHGLGHWIAARLGGVHMQSLRRTPTGLRLVANGGFASYDAELYCALGGPVANAAAALLCRLIALAHPALSDFMSPLIVLSLYLGLLNLLPLEGFDGARILHCWLCCRHRRLPSLSPARADCWIACLSCALLLLLWMIAVYLLLRRGSALSLYLFCLQLFRSTAMSGKSVQKGEIGSIRENTKE